MEAERLGKYQLVRHLASGGMASVYLARLSGLGGFERHVVLKTLRSEIIDDDTLVPMFLDEARLVATLHHQHIAQVYEVGCDHQTYFLAMEYVHGETVRHVLEVAGKRDRTLPLDFGLTVVCAAAAGLHHAHERRDADGVPLGIVHRDVTPSNVIVSYDGSIKLIDFGIAKASVRTTITRSGLIKGKVGYMAPEQVRGFVVDRRSDVFALGVLAYELTTQARAFAAASQFEQLQRAAHGDLVRPSQIIPGYPSSLEEVVMTALELDPDDRYPDAEAMRLALTRVASELGLSLGEAAVIPMLADLCGPRPEPWLVESIRADEEVTPSIETPPLARMRLPLPDPRGFARGTRAVDAVRAIDIPDDEEPTNPIDLVDLTPVMVVDEPGARSRASTLPLSRRAAAGQVPDSVLGAAASMQVSPMTMPPPVWPAPHTTPLAIPRRTRSALIGGSIVLAVGIIAAAIVGFFDEEELAAQPAVVFPRPVIPRRSPPPPPPPKVVETRQPATPPPTPDRVTLEVITDPPGATVVLDGVRLGTSPFRAEIPIKGGAWLKVRRVDHLPVRKRVSLDHDVHWTVRLPRRRGPFLLP